MPLRRPRPPDDEKPTDEQIAGYAAEMCGILRQLTGRRPKLRTLHYLLDMARLEGERTVEQVRKG